MVYTTTAFGERYTVDTTNHTLTIAPAHPHTNTPNTQSKTYTQEEMQDIARAFQHTNRIYKPTALNYYTDCHNGRAGDWR